MMWPFLACSGIMCVVWILALLNPGEQIRKIAFLSWIVFILLASFIYYLVIILNGSVMDHECTDENVQAVNDVYDALGVSETYTAE